MVSVAVSSYQSFPLFVCIFLSEENGLVEDAYNDLFYRFLCWLQCDFLASRVVGYFAQSHACPYDIELIHN